MQNAPRHMLRLSMQRRDAVGVLPVPWRERSFYSKVVILPLFILAESLGISALYILDADDYGFMKLMPFL